MRDPDSFFEMANIPKDTKTEQHKQRHIMLHKSLDEIIADFITHTGKLPSETPLLELMKWAYEQTLTPTETDNP